MVSEYRGTLAITSFQVLDFILFRKMQGKFIFISIQVENLEKSKVLEFQRFQGFWSSSVSMDFSCLYASSSSLYCICIYVIFYSTCCN